METRVLLTIDTELTWRHHVSGKSWEDNYMRSVEPARVGLSYQLSKLREHELKATFFVDPMPAVLFGLEPVKRMVSTVLDAGQDVQLHLHPMWVGAKKDGTAADDTRFELTEFDKNAQRDLIARARDLLMEAGAPEPVAFRSGSYAANCDTMEALCALGITYDSSHNGCEDVSDLLLDCDWVAPVNEKGVVEIPVSQVVQPNGAVRHMQICAVTLAEMRAGLIHAIANQHPVFTIVSHSFELATRNGEQANSIIKSRFDELCDLLNERREAAPTAWFTELGDLDLTTDGGPAKVSPIRVAHRYAEQLWANIIENRAA